MPSIPSITDRPPVRTRRAERGNASVELVLSLPVVLALVLTMVIVSGVFVARHRCTMTSRAAAWTYAQAGRWPDVRDVSGAERARLVRTTAKVRTPFPVLTRYLSDIPGLNVASPPRLADDTRAVVRVPVKNRSGIFSIDREMGRESTLTRDLWIRPGEEGLAGFFPNLRWGFPLVPRGIPGLNW